MVRTLSALLRATASLHPAMAGSARRVMAWSCRSSHRESSARARSSDMHANMAVATAFLIMTSCASASPASTSAPPKRTNRTALAARGASSGRPASTGIASLPCTHFAMASAALSMSEKPPPRAASLHPLTAASCSSPTDMQSSFRWARSACPWYSSPIMFASTRARWPSICAPHPCSGRMPGCLGSCQACTIMAAKYSSSTSAPTCS
mmetsp:Transcript_13652/g.34968  ORF Transcript_13652/g.34968 Transcript_13652/m.34968 type:complete len:208 (+) Transcript_13652:180-803(+)